MQNGLCKFFYIFAEMCHAKKTCNDNGSCDNDGMCKCKDNYFGPECNSK